MMGSGIKRVDIVTVFHFLLFIISNFNCSWERVNMMWMKRSKDNCKEPIISLYIIEAGVLLFLIPCCFL